MSYFPYYCRCFIQLMSKLCIWQYSCCYLQEDEISTPFPKHLEGIILAFFEEDGGDPRFFLSGLDLVMSSTSDRQFPTTRIIRGIQDRLFQVQV